MSAASREQEGEQGDTSGSAVLIDNSLYFSFAKAIEGEKLTAQTIYNAAGFAESCVLYDRVYLAPTSYWTPPANDPLFGTQGPCRALSLEQMSLDELGDLFATATSE